MKKFYSMLLVTIVVLTGCGGGSSSDPKANVVVTTGANETVVENFINEYNTNEGKEYQVSWEPITDDYQATLSTRIAGGTDVCVMAVDYTLLPQLVDAGKIIPLDDYVTADKAATFLPSVYESFNLDGKQYGLPLDYNTLGIFYNKDMFDKAGVSYPDETWTWADYTDAMAKIKPTLAENQAVFSAGNEYHRWRELVLAAGGDLVNDKGELDFTNEAAVEAYNAWLKLKTDGYYMTPAELGSDWGGQAFFENQAAITIEGSWAISAIAGGNPDMNYGVSQIPLFGDATEHSTMIYSNALAISSDCANQDGAYEWMDWYTTEDMAAKRSVFQKEAGTSSGGMPSIATENAKYLETYPEYKIFAEGGEYGKASGLGTVNDQVIINNINAVLEESLFDPSLDAKEQLQKAQDKTTEEAGL